MRDNRVHDHIEHRCFNFKEVFSKCNKFSDCLFSHHSNGIEMCIKKTQGSWFETLMSSLKSCDSHQVVEIQKMWIKSYTISTPICVAFNVGATQAFCTLLKVDPPNLSMTCGILIGSNLLW